MNALPPDWGTIAKPEGFLNALASPAPQVFFTACPVCRKSRMRLAFVPMTTFDYVIVGAGSAGCVLANRLSESGHHSVLVLEAGGSDRRFYIQMPLGYGKTFYDKTVNWLYTTEPDPGLNGQRDHWPRGKVLGGSSSINAMVYIRGQAADYESWRAAGNPGWGWDDVLAAYKAMEDVETGDPPFMAGAAPCTSVTPACACTR
jgi:choline dehydrogenase